MGEGARALTAGSNRNRGAHLSPHHFKPGQSGNPTGRPKGTTLRELKEAARRNIPLAVEMLAGLLRSEDERMRFDAVQFTYLYGFGKPMEGTDIAHLEAMSARHAELTATVTETPELPATVPPEVRPPVLPESTSVAHEANPPAPVLTSPTLTEAPRDVSDSREPSGLRCLYRGKDGQCEALAADGAQWCAPHRDKLFNMVNS